MRMTATPEIIPTDLTLEIGADVSPERFMTAARAFFGYVNDLSQATAPEDNLPHWVVRVREGSALLAVAPAPSVPAEIIQAILTRAERGITALAEGNVEHAALSDSALRHLRTLAEMHPVPVRVWVKKKPHPVGPTIARIVREDLRADYNDYGTIEGRLETIADRDGSLQFLIRDVMLGQKVRCYFPEELLPEVFDKFRKRVEVSGIIKYRKNGVAVNIEVDRIDVLPDDSELPTAEDVRGVLRN